MSSTALQIIRNNSRNKLYCN